ncbi:MAG TPA: serine/threonine-protein kinase [Gemmatimonadales bacterium]|nr:serine/threonine-protein kinase [Gemmatimonadales bacterium]
MEANDWNRVDDPVLPALERQFQVEGMLRRGVASRIYLARDQVTGRLCSLKVLPLSDEQPGLIERFRADAQRAAALDHSHIVALHSFGATDEAVWYAMEYVQGRSLGDLLRTADRMDLKTCLRLVEQIASALEYGHRRGITHGNLKPANVLVDPEGWARVADFGLSSAFGTVPRRQPELSIEENFGHIAPERFGADGVVGPASDQYALAVLTFACLARRPPFVGETLDEIMVHHLEGPVPLLAESRPDLPAAVSAALARAMKREPEDRFHGVLDLASALAGVSLPEQTVLSFPAARAPEPVAAKPVTHPLLHLVEAERHTREPEPARPEPPPAVAAAASSAPVTPAPPAEPPADEHRPPLLLVDREAGERESRDDLEVVDEDTEEERERVKKPVPDDDEDDDAEEGKPVLLWPAHENAAPDDHAAAAAAVAAAALASEHLNGGERTPLLFPDQLRVARPGLTFGARVWEMARRWTALPRSTRLGSSAAAAVLLMALVWWRVAKGHEEQHASPRIVNAGPVDTQPTIVTPPPRKPKPKPPVSGPGTQQRNTPSDTVKTAPRPPATATAAEPAHLYIASTPWGVLYVDDKQIGNTPQLDYRVPPGSHSIRVSRDGFLSYETVIAIESGETLKLTDIVLQEKPQ